MVVPNSANPNEYTLITPTLDGGSTPTLYTVNGTTRNITPGNGDTFNLTLNSTWAPLATTSGQPHTLSTCSSTIVQDGIEYLTEIGMSNRTLQPSTWRSKATRLLDNVVLHDISWLRRGGGDPPYAANPSPPAGGATDINERWWERFGVGGSTPSTMAFHHNPTMGGSGDRPAGGDPGVLAKMYTGRPFHFVVRSGADPVAEGGCAPLDFGGDPDNYAYSDHGYGISDTGEDQPAWWWRMKMFRRIKPALNGNPRLTQVDSGTYIPFGWKATDYAAPSLLAQFAENWDLIAKTFDTAYAYDIANRELTALAQNWPDGPLNPDPAGYSSALNFAKHRSVFQWGATTVSAAQPAFAVTSGTPGVYGMLSGYGALIYVNAATGFTVALATKLEACTNLDEDSRNDTHDACQMQAWHREFINTTNSPLANEGEIAYIIHKSRVARKPGWILRRSWVYTGEFNKVLADLNALHDSGQMNSKPDLEDIPIGLLDSLAPSTDGASGSATLGTIADTDGDANVAFRATVGKQTGVVDNEFATVSLLPKKLEQGHLQVTMTGTAIGGSPLNLIIEGRLTSDAPWALVSSHTLTDAVTKYTSVPVMPEFRVRFGGHFERQGLIEVSMV